MALDASEAVLTSAKTGLGVEEVLEAIVAKVPAPKGDRNAPLKALIFDSWYDSYRGVIVLFRVFDVIKPYPANRLERLHGGVGVMADDAMAAVYANLALRAALALSGRVIG